MCGDRPPLFEPSVSLSRYVSYADSRATCPPPPPRRSRIQTMLCPHLPGVLLHLLAWVASRPLAHLSRAVAVVVEGEVKGATPGGVVEVEEWGEGEKLLHKKPLISWVSGFLVTREGGVIHRNACCSRRTVDLVFLQCPNR